MKINLTDSMLISAAGEEGNKVVDGVVYFYTGKCTGRSPGAKRIVKDNETELTVDWCSNSSISVDEWHTYLKRFESYLKNNSANLYQQDVVAVRDPRIDMHVRVYTETAVHSLFARNMFVPHSETSTDPEFITDWTIYHFPSLLPHPTVLVSFSDKKILIAGTSYSGEIKKSIFTVLNYTFVQDSTPMLPMHCSVNMDYDRTSPAIFFGLSGTGKTTLSSDPKRLLLGDDEHAWTDDGLTNFEGGCYAKTIRLSSQDEPEIWEACHAAGTILENVIADEFGVADFDDGSITENCRASYSISSIPNSDHLGCVREHPVNIIMLTCDAFGVLPPVAKLSTTEAVKQFALGYTAKVAGTEDGITEPVATFSPCFGGPFMPLHVSKYAKILKEKIEKHGTVCWLVNTGWTGGPYGKGTRISIKNTRKIISGILDGSLSKQGTVDHQYTGLTIPIHEEIPRQLLLPELGWADLDAYKESVAKLNLLFGEKEKEVMHGI